jgi:subtilisin family serine protease
MTQRSTLLGCGSARRLTVAMAWLGTAALVVGGATPSASAATPTPAPAPLLNVSPAETVPGEYIVVLKSDASLRAEGLRSTAAPDRVEAAAEHATTLGAEVTHEFKGAIQGYSADLSRSELDAVRNDPAVEFVQPNRVFRTQAGPADVPVRYQPIRAAGTTTKPESWGLDRVDQRNLPLDKKYYATATGKGVTAFIVDSGIAIGQEDLKHVLPGVDVVNDGQNTNDCNGHGTHVAGTVGGGIFGVAKEVNLVPIRVLNCDGAGDVATVLAGLDAVIGMGIPGPKVLNLSLGGPADATVDAAVQNVINAGITVVIAAGNGDRNGNPLPACSVSPARLRTAITVGATTITDKRTNWSNYGSCVDIYAPGNKIMSDWISNDGDWWVRAISGTSMAAPHVTGTAAMYLQRHPTATPAQVQAALLKTATKNKVTNVSSRWPRSLLLALQPAVKPASVTSGNKLRYNQSLVRGNKICSANKVYCLSPAASGKLVLRKVKGKKKVVWSAGKSVYWTRMTSTGALSSYDGYGRRVWTSKKTGGKATLYVISTGYLKILRDSDKKVLWTSRM